MAARIDINWQDYLNNLSVCKQVLFPRLYPAITLNIVGVIGILAKPVNIFHKGLSINPPLLVNVLILQTPQF